MDQYGAETYGQRIAGVYDSWYASVEPGMIETLVELASGGPVLELGIGTGRVALPLRERGVEVHGVDASPAMVERMREKPGGGEVPVAFGDFAEVPVPGEAVGEAPYRLVYIPFNTFFALVTQEDQLRCFANAVDRLAPGGLFALEVFVPDVARFDRGQRMNSTLLEAEEVVFDLSQHDPVHQRIVSQHVRITPEGVTFYPVSIRYAWPAELDLMARLAGLRLRERWSDWSKSPFDASAKRHVSVYERDAG